MGGNGFGRFSFRTGQLGFYMFSTFGKIFFSSLWIRLLRVLLIFRQHLSSYSLMGGFMLSFKVDNIYRV